MTTWTDGLPGQLDVEVGQERRVPLTPVAGGYEWVVEGGDGVVEVTVDRLPPPPPPADGLPSSGSPGSELVLTGVAPGAAEVRLAIRRPWEDGSALAEHALHVDVR
jgi:hypothetical protein